MSRNFFRVSNRCHDGLLFLGKLAGRWTSGAPLTVEEAAGGLISPGYLEQVALQLKEAGFIKGKRGPGGGYLLARAPGSISVGAVIEALEGPLALVDCQVGTCSAAATCHSKSLWDTLQGRITKTLEGTTLADIAEKSSVPEPRRRASAMSR